MTATRRDVREALAALGERSVAEPRPEFVAALEARLLAEPVRAPSFDERTGLAPVVALSERPSRRRVAGALAVAAASIAGVVLAGSLSGWFGSGSSPRRVHLAAAVDTTVVLPDGSEVAGHDGLALPNGAVVLTGPNGRATAGGVEIPPSGAAVVNSGQVVVQPTPPPTAPQTAPPTTTPTTQAPALTLPPLTVPTLTVPTLLHL